MKAYKIVVRIALVMMVFCAGGRLLMAQSKPASKFPPESLHFLADEGCSTELSSSIRVPKGTEIWREGKTLRFKVPSGYVVWNLTKAGTYLSMETGDVTCSCSGGGCDPVSQGGTIGCLIKPSCSSGCCQRTAASEMAIIVTEALGTVRPASKIELKTLPLAPPQLADVPEIADAIKSYLDRAYGGRERPSVETKGNRAWAPKGHILLPVNVYGYLANLLVPASAKCLAEELASSSSLKDCGDEGGDSSKCRCNQGTGCTYWSKPLVGVSGCDSGTCSSCEMLTN